MLQPLAGRQMLKVHIWPAGDAAILVEFGNKIDPFLQAQVASLAELLSSAAHPAISEWVPTYRSLLLHYDPLQITYAELSDWLHHLVDRPASAQAPSRRRVTIPVLYGGEMGPDLDAVSKHTNLPPADVIDLHQEAEYLVYMLGFLPCFPYLGGLNDRLATPRLASPRTSVPAGSVGIAGQQTGVYPLTSPGGWQLIGRTPLKLYDPERSQPFLLAAGDSLQFKAITQAEFDAMSTAELASTPPRQTISDREPSTSYVEVVAPGLFSTIQDLGRRGWQQFGVPVAGVYDSLAARLANCLVGNPPDAALLEITYAGPTLTTDVPLVAAFAGGEVAPSLDGDAVQLWQSFLWEPGQELKVGNLTAGARTYLAIRGGWQVPFVMGSRSTYVRAAIGGLDGRQLKAGDMLPVSPSDTPGPQRHLPQAFWPPVGDKLTLRFVPGPQTDHFEPGAAQELSAYTYTVSQVADRMGVRLQGPPIIPLQADIISDAIAYGSIQVPSDGQPIIMGPDRQTTGGYPKIGTVIQPDMRLLAQASPGSTIRLQAITVEEAGQAAKTYDLLLQKLSKLADNKIKGHRLRVQIGAESYHSFVEVLPDTKEN